MPNIFEDRVSIILYGAVIEAILAIILWRTGRGRYLTMMVVVAAVVLVLLVVERLVVTDRERITATLESARAAVQANDLPGVLDQIAPSAKEARQYTELALRRLEFSEARIRDLKINIDNRAKPPVAKAQLTGFTSFKDRRGEFPYNNYLAELVVELQKTPDRRWLITDIVEVQPTGLKGQKGR